MSVTVQQRRDTAASWTSVNPVLHQGEIGAETDTGKAKLGDGATAWNSLAYWKPDGAADGVSSVNSKTGAVTLAYSDVGADQSGAAAAAQAAAIAASLPTLAQASASASATLAVNTVTTVTAATALTMTLPTSVTGALIVVERESASAASVAVTGNIRGVGAQTITLSLGSESEGFLGYGGSWWPLFGHKTLSSLQALFAQLANNLSDLPSPTAARTSLQLGTLSTDPRFRPNRSLRGAVVASKCYVPYLTSQSATPGTARTRHVIAAACTDIRLLFCGWYVTGNPGTDTDAPNAYTFKASIEDTNGNIYRVTFGGSQTGNVDPGGVITSDPVALEFTAGQVLYVRTYISIAGTYWIPMSTSGTTNGEGFTPTTDLTAPGSGAVNYQVTYVYGPTAILGTPKSGAAPCVAILGDSIAYGSKDGAFGGADITVQGQPTGGFIVRALNAGGIPWVNMGHPNDTCAAAIVDANHFRRHALLAGVTHAIDEYGVNDLYGGGSLTTFYANKLTLWNLLTQRGIIAWTTTLTPETSSTDGWATTGNQTASTGNANRVTYNTWLRAGAPIIAGVAVAPGTPNAVLAGQAAHPLTGYFEVAWLGESSHDSGIWATSQVRTVTDGAISASSAVLTSATAAFTSGDYLKAVSIPGAGSAGGLYTGRIITITNGTTVTLDTNAATTVSSGATVNIGIPTVEGIHPAGIFANTLAPGVTTASISLPW